MATLTQYIIVNAKGIGSVEFNGTSYPISAIDDQVAALLYGKTHIIQQVEPVAAGTTSAGEGEAPATIRKRRG